MPPWEEDSEAGVMRTQGPVVRLTPAPRLSAVAPGSLLLDLAARNERQVVILVRSEDGSSWFDYRSRLDADDALVGKLTTMAHECADYLNAANGRKP